MLKQFSKTVSIYGIAPAFSKSVGFFLIPIYTRVFCPEEYGIIDLFNTVVYLFTIFIELKIYSAVGRFFEKTENKRILVSTGLWLEVLLSLVIVPPLLYFSADIARYVVGDTSYKTILILALLWLPLNALASYFLVVMRFVNKPKLFVRISISQTIVRVAGSLIAVLAFDSGIAGIYIGYIVGDLTALALFLSVLRPYIGLKVDLPLLGKLLSFALPLVPAAFAYFGSNVLHRIIMVKYMSLSTIGIFAVALKVASVFGMLIIALRMAWEPFVYAQLEQDDHKKQFIRIYKMSILFLCFLVCVMTLFSKEIVFIITTGEYFAAASLIGVLSINFVFKILIELAGIGPKIVRKTVYDSVARMTGVAVSVLSMFFLIPLYGVMGAALALCLGSCTSLVISWYYTEKFYPVGYPKLFTFSLIGLMFLVVLVNNSFAVTFTVKMAVTLLFFLIFIYYRDVIKRIIDST